MTWVARLLCRVSPPRCDPPDPIAFDDEGADSALTDASVHRSAQVETSMQLQTGLFRRQTARIAEALEAGDDDALAQVTRAMMRPPAGKMWLEDALTRTYHDRTQP